MVLATLQIMAVVTFLLVILAYFLVSGFRIGILERVSMAFEKTHRETRLDEVFEAHKKETPATRLAFVLTVLGLLMLLALTHNLFFAVVTSGSMVPTLHKGDMFLAQAIVIEPEVGDIVMFNRPDIYLPVAHRVIGISDDKIYTGGDASGPDEWRITEDDIIAEAVTIAGEPIVVPNVGSYFVLEAKELRSIGPYGQEYLFYKNLVTTFKSFALAIVIICIAVYIYLEIGNRRY
ncbi:MAG: S26 family signal peptidase [Archaeoglobaceae archaeon]